MATKRKPAAPIPAHEMPYNIEPRSGGRVRRALREPSTWAGLAALAALFGHSIAPADAVQIGGGLSALLGIVLPEGR